MVALCVLPTAAVVALKAADVDPAITVTEDGVVNAALLLDSDTTTLPEGAAVDKVTVQVEVEPETTVPGEHCRPAMLTAGAKTVMLPPVPVTASPCPLGNAPRVPLTEIGTVEPLGADPNPTVTVAIVPLAITVSFMPMAMHIIVPLLALQVRVFPAAATAGPAATVMEPMLPGT